jgi:two-component system, chemotaxis family, protein-glutamate methylesterase/glutaminase
MSVYDVVVIGASWGGLKAIETVLAELPEDFPVPIVVAQHRDDDADDQLLPRLLNRHTPLRVADADDKAALDAGTVLLAPPGYHVLLTDDGCVELSVDEPVSYSRPSIDVLFESTADAFGPRAVAVLLTGANADGAAGLRAIAERGGHTIVQDPTTAERPEMPKAALDVMQPDVVAALDDIAGLLCEACGKEPAR